MHTTEPRLPYKVHPKIYLLILFLQSRAQSIHVAGLYSFAHYKTELHFGGEHCKLLFCDRRSTAVGFGSEGVWEQVPGGTCQD